MIKVRDVRFWRGKRCVLDIPELTLEAQKVIAMIGPNGAGKSTLLSLMSRLLTLKEGEIFFDELEVNRSPAKEMAKKVAILQQHSQFMSRFNVEDLLLFARYPYHKGRPKAEDRRCVEEMLDYFALTSIRHVFLDELSGGQRQMALVAMVFCQQTKYILLDEPLNNLDMFHAKHLMTTLRRAIDDWNKSIIIVLHDINYASQYADHIVAFQQGKLLFQGETKAVMTEQNLLNLYQVDVEIIEHRGKTLSVHY